MYNLILLTNILRLIDEQGLSKAEFARRAGISGSFLTDLTQGKANPSLRIMEQIAKALETSLPLLLEATDLDRAALSKLDSDLPHSSLPDGYRRVTAILTTFEAFKVEKWDEENRKSLKLSTPSAH